MGYTHLPSSIAPQLARLQNLLPGQSSSKKERKSKGPAQAGRSGTPSPSQTVRNTNKAQGSKAASTKIHGYTTSTEQPQLPSEDAPTFPHARRWLGQELSCSLKDVPAVRDPAEEWSRISKEAVQRLVKLDEARWKQLLTGIEPQVARELLDYVEIVLKQIGMPRDSNTARMRKSLGRLSVMISLSSGQQPSSLYINNVVLPTTPAAGGAFADVFKVEYNSTVVAIKRIRTHNMDSIQSRCEVSKVFQREALIWKYLDHPNVLPFCGMVGSSEDSCDPEMVYPWMSQGDLRRYVSSKGKDLKNADAMRLVVGAACGLHYLHFEDIVHGDLCGTNVLVDGKGNAVLADFGVTEILSRSILLSQNNVGSSFQAPEMYSPSSFGYGDMFCGSTQTDVFAFGSICYEIYENETPYQKYHPHVVMRLLSKGARPDRPTADEDGRSSIPDEIWKIMQDCWEEKPRDRPTSRDLLQRLLQTKAVREEHSIEKEREAWQEQVSWEPDDVVSQSQLRSNQAKGSRRPSRLEFLRRRLSSYGS